MVHNINPTLDEIIEPNEKEEGLAGCFKFAMYDEEVDCVDEGGDVVGGPYKIKITISKAD